MIFDSTGAVLRVEPFDAATDTCARNQGITLQLTTRTAAAFEVWRGPVKVASFYGRKSAWCSQSRRGEISTATEPQGTLFGPAVRAIPRRTAKMARA
jgi:hypothetical protein